MEFGNIAVVIRHSDLHITLVNNPKAFNTIARAVQIAHDAMVKAGKEKHAAVNCSSLLLGLRGIAGQVPPAWYWLAVDEKRVEHLIYIDYEESPVEISYGAGRLGTDMYEWDRREFKDVEVFLKTLMTAVAKVAERDRDNEAVAKIKAKLAAAVKNGKQPTAKDSPLGKAVAKLASKSSSKAVEHVASSSSHKVSLNEALAAKAKQKKAKAKR